MLRKTSRVPRVRKSLFAELSTIRIMSDSLRTRSIILIMGWLVFSSWRVRATPCPQTFWISIQAPSRTWFEGMALLYISSRLWTWITTTCLIILRVATTVTLSNTPKNRILTFRTHNLNQKGNKLILGDPRVKPKTRLSTTWCKTWMS